MTGSRPLRVGLAIFRLDPAGGLEQHCLRLAAILRDRGCAVTLATTRAPASPPEGMEVLPLRQRGRSNHGRIAAFARDAARALGEGDFDRTVVFHAIPGFEAIFCADPSRARPGFFRRWLPRYRAFARLECAAFAEHGAKFALMLSSAQLHAFQSAHGPGGPRLALLPPTVDRRRADAKASGPSIREAARRRLGLPEEGPVWLWMGLQPKTKGLDRALAALSGRPDAKLIVLGLQARSKAGRGAARLAERLGVTGQLLWLGFVSEAGAAEAMAAADLLVHPSRADVTGTVILEAMARGLPAIATALCGYSEHIAAAGAGLVLPEPFRAADLAEALRQASPDRLAAWSAAALAYTRREELFTGLERAADLILEDPPRR